DNLFFKRADPKQQFIHVNICSKDVPPKADQPGIRLCGAWPTAQHVHDRVIQLKNMDNSTHLCWPSQKWRLLVSSIDHLNPEYVKQKKKQLLKKYKCLRDQANKIFQTKDIDAEITIEHKEPADDTSINTERQTAVQSTIMQFSSELRLAEQRYAAVIFVPDLISGTEPLFRFLKAFASLEECETYATLTSKYVLPQYNIDVVDMYEWLWPTLVDPNDLNESWQNPILDGIMHRMKAQHGDVYSYTHWQQNAK
ncbi:MAG: hypothetical protein KGL95_13410, partial [Patescibacteria group bacterium]|nr:hypothetical protein [Patescibacteria group bacterium]